MGDDVRLTAHERAAFADIEQRLVGGRRGRHRGHWSGGAALRTAADGLLLGVAVLLLVGGLVGAPVVGASGFVVAVIATFRLTRRWSWARFASWCRRAWEPPPAQDDATKR